MRRVPGDLLEFKYYAFSHWGVYMGTGGYLAWHHATTQFFKHALQASSGLVRPAAESSACQPSDYFPSSSHPSRPDFGAQLQHDEHYLGHIVGPRMWSKVSSPLLLGRETSRVHIEPLSGVEDKYQRVRVRNCQYDAALTSFPAHDIVQRVLAQVRKVSCFRLFSNNCEHFATWARYGVALSDQAWAFPAAGAILGPTAYAALTTADGALALSTNPVGIGMMLPAWHLTAARLRHAAMRFRGLWQRWAVSTQLSSLQPSVSHEEAVEELVRLKSIYAHISRLHDMVRCSSNDMDEQAVSRLHKQLQTLQDTLDFALLQRHNNTMGQAFTNADQVLMKLRLSSLQLPQATDTLHSWLLHNAHIIESCIRRCHA